MSITRTAISSPEQITFCNSPIHIKVVDPNIKKIGLKLWIWNGSLNKTLGAQNYSWLKDKVSDSDDYIELEISEYIRSFLINPKNATNTSQPTFAYNTLADAAMTGQAVFWQVQIIAYIGSEEPTTFDGYTNIATLGWKWNKEKTLFNVKSIVAGGGIGFDFVREKYTDPRINYLFNQSFDLTQTLEACTTENVITRVEPTIPTLLNRYSREPVLIVYLNKIGLWDFFVSHGKVTPTTKIKRDTNNISYRQSSAIDNQYQHSKSSKVSEVIRGYTINTGSLKENMVEQVEEIIYSPKVYLIKFKGDVYLDSDIEVGITIDNTYITIDDLNTTIDSMDVGADVVAYFNTYEQIPVIVTDTDFLIKNRVNNKKDIDFNIKFEETNSKIDNIV